MLIRLLPVVLIAAAAAPLNAGEAERFFSERAKDFGTVSFGPTLTHQFKITNTSKQTVQIASVRVSCGCVSASIPVTTLPPGQSTYVNAQMDTKRFIGHKEVLIYVTFSSPREEVVLSVRANRDDNASVPAVTKSTEGIAMGTVRKGGEGTGSVQFVIRNEPAFEVRSVTTATEYVKAEAKLVRRERSEVVYEVAATLKPGLDVGTWTTEITLNTNSPTNPTVRLSLLVDIVAPITATPSALQFPVVRVGETKEMNFVVRGDKPFKIVEVTGGDATVTAVADGGESKAAHVVRVVFQPRAEGDMSKDIIVVTDSGATGRIVIPVRAKAKAE